MDWTPDGVWWVDNDLGKASQHILHIQANKSFKLLCRLEYENQKLKALGAIDNVALKS